MNDRTGKVLRIIAVVFMGLTAAMNLLGGIGTVCAAFLTKKYPPMWPLLDYQWLYQTLMIVTIVIGILCIWSTIGLARGGERAYRNALILLVIGTIVGGIHMYASLSLRGKAVPANMKLYTNAVTLLLFLLIRLPGLRDRVDFSKPTSSSDRATTGGVVAIVAGSVVITTELWVGASHVFQGSNWVRLLQAPLIAGGTILTLGGFALLMWARQGVLAPAPQQR